MNINLHIERLVLDGVTIEPQQRLRLQQAMQSELTRLLANGELSADFSGGLSVPRLTVPSIQLPAGNHPVQLGQQIARAVYGGIGHE